MIKIERNEVIIEGDYNVIEEEIIHMLQTLKAIAVSCQFKGFQNIDRWIINLTKEALESPEINNHSIMLVNNKQAYINDYEQEKLEATYKFFIHGFKEFIVQKGLESHVIEIIQDYLAV